MAHGSVSRARVLRSAAKGDGPPEAGDDTSPSPAREARDALALLYRLADGATGKANP